MGEHRLRQDLRARGQPGKRRGGGWRDTPTPRRVGSAVASGSRRCPTAGSLPALPWRLPHRHLSAPWAPAFPSAFLPLPPHPTPPCPDPSSETHPQRRAALRPPAGLFGRASRCPGHGPRPSPGALRLPLPVSPPAPARPAPSRPVGSFRSPRPFPLLAPLRLPATRGRVAAALSPHPPPAPAARPGQWVRNRARGPAAGAAAGPGARGPPLPPQRLPPLVPGAEPPRISLSNDKIKSRKEVTLNLDSIAHRSSILKFLIEKRGESPKKKKS